VGHQLAHAVTVAAAPASGNKRRRNLHRIERKTVAEPLVSPETELGTLEALLREFAPVALDKLAAHAGMEPSAVANLLDRHPCVYRGGDGQYRILARLPYEFVPPAFSEDDLVVPSESQTITCPSCGRRHVVTGGMMRKIEKGLRTARCPRCAVKGAAIRISHGPLPRDVFEREAMFWLDRYDDVAIVNLALTLGSENASVDNVRRWRELLLG
jgi:transcription elongation factor Elf1